MILSYTNCGKCAGIFKAGAIRLHIDFQNKSNSFPPRYWTFGCADRAPPPQPGTF
jgi:hypothetical protein